MKALQACFAVAALEVCFKMCKYLILFDLKAALRVKNNFSSLVNRTPYQAFC